MTAPTTRELVSRALMRLANTVHTFGKDPASALRDYVDRLVEFGPYGVKAVDEWPTMGTNWPSLKELLDLARDLQHRAKLDAAAAVGVGATPVAKFVAAVLTSERGGRGYVRSWLDPTTYPMFDAGVIRTSELGAQRLQFDFGELAKSLNVRIEHDKVADVRLRLFVEQLRAEGKLETTRRKVFAA